MIKLGMEFTTAGPADDIVTTAKFLYDSWLSRIEAWETKKYYAVVLFGREGSPRARPLSKKVYIAKHLCETVVSAIIYATHLPSVKFIKVRSAGQILAGKWRESWVPREKARETSKYMFYKYGRGWLYKNEEAQAEAEQILTGLREALTASRTVADGGTFKFNVYDKRWRFVKSFWAGTTWGLAVVGDYILEDSGVYTEEVYIKRVS